MNFVETSRDHDNYKIRFRETTFIQLIIILRIKFYSGLLRQIKMDKHPVETGFIYICCLSKYLQICTMYRIYDVFIFR